jgi:hypothetical protein
LHDLIQGQNNIFQAFAFAADFLGFFGVVPERVVFCQLDDFFQTRGFRIVVKDTPSGRARGPRGPPAFPGFD